VCSLQKSVATKVKSESRKKQSKMGFENKGGEAKERR
jgi:hypothetical protein